MKLGNLLKKELGELLTKQAIFSMIFTCLLLVVIVLLYIAKFYTLL